MRGGASAKTNTAKRPFLLQDGASSDIDDEALHLALEKGV